MLLAVVNHFIEERLLHKFNDKIAVSFAKGERKGNLRVVLSFTTTKALVKVVVAYNPESTLLKISTDVYVYIPTTDSLMTKLEFTLIVPSVKQLSTNEEERDNKLADKFDFVYNFIKPWL